VPIPRHAPAPPELRSSFIELYANPPDVSSLCSAGPCRDELTHGVQQVIDHVALDDRHARQLRRLHLAAQIEWKAILESSTSHCMTKCSKPRRHLV